MPRDGDMAPVAVCRSEREIRFEVDVRNRFFDMQPIWRAYRRVSDLQAAPQDASSDSSPSTSR